MAYLPSGDRNFMAVMRRVSDYAWFGRTSTAAQAPLALNNESITALNAAGTGTVSLIKANASNLPELGAGAVIPGATFNDTNGLNRFVANPTAKDLTDASATSLFDVACASGARCGGIILFTVETSNGTDHQALSGVTSYSAVNKAGTLTLTITQLSTVEAKAVSTGTLTLAWTFVTGTSKGTVKLQTTGSMTETVNKVTYTVFPLVGAVTIL